MHHFTLGRSGLLIATLAATVPLAPAARSATDFEVEEWSMTWQDPDLDGTPNPILRVDDFEDGLFDGAPLPECLSVGTQYCEISGEVLPGDESAGRLNLRNPSFNSVSNQVDQFLLLLEAHRGPATATARFILDVPAPGQSYSLQLISNIVGDFEQVAVFLSRGAPGTPAESNLIAGVLDVKRDLLLSALDLGAAASIVADSFDLELSFARSGSVLRPAACVRLGTGDCLALDLSGASEVADSDFVNAIIGVVPTQVIAIDVKPGSETNPIRVGARGVIPVTILGSPDFDVGDVDVDTLRFGPGAAALADRLGPHVVDANRDGFDDLLAHFRSDESGIARGDEAACVMGERLGGTPFEGCDNIRTIPSE